jgi:hypothetical protein
MSDLIPPIQITPLTPKKPSHHRLLWSALVASIVVIILVAISLIINYQHNKNRLQKGLEDLAANLNNSAANEKIPERDGSLVLSTPKTKISVGDIIEVKILVDTKGANIVLAGAVINFDSAKLKLVGEPNTDDSVFKMAVVNDVNKNIIEIIRGNAGNADYLDDGKDNGYTGELGLLATLKFKALQAGTSAIALSPENSSLILDDGRGTLMGLDFKDLNIEIK